MSLKKQIDDKLNQALKAKDKNTYPTLRLIVSAIKDAEIAGRSKGQRELKDSDIISLLKKMVKQRNESCEVYEKAGRKELLENEKKEIKVEPKEEIKTEIRWQKLITQIYSENVNVILDCLDNLKVFIREYDYAGDY